MCRYGSFARPVPPERCRPKPIRENYDPRNGAGSHATDFGWSAAHLLLLFAP